MADKNTIKNWFRTGLKPSQAQFWATWDSFWHKDEKIPITAIDDIEAILAEKADAEVLAHHLNDATAHADLFLGKEDKFKKGAASGYVPLNEFVKIASEYLNIVNDLFTGGATAILSAEQGVVLQTQIENINALLASDNVNLDNVQELVDAIETVKMSLDAILVNDLTTGGTTKALTAEMGKTLKGLIDNLVMPVQQIISFIAINEGNGIGYIIANRNPLNYGNVGLGAVDFSYSNYSFAEFGALGKYSSAFGEATISRGKSSVVFGFFSEALGDFSTAMGVSTVASGQSSVAMGESTKAEAYASVAMGWATKAMGHSSFAGGFMSNAKGPYSFAFGFEVVSKGESEVVFGRYNTDYTPIGQSNPLDRVFGIGNGTSQYQKSDAVVVLFNGLTTLPSVTNTLITAEPTGKAVVTKEWAEARFKTKTVSSSNYFQNLTTVSTVIEGMTAMIMEPGKYKVEYNGQYNTTLANITQQSVVDLNALYLNLNGQPVTNINFPTFTAGSKILPGVYETSEAVGPVGSITLDGQGNSNSIFIFRTIAAFSTGAGCVFNLTNGASARNVFVIAGGVITLGAGSNIAGTLISPLAACGVGAGAFLNGRIFSMAAAVSTMGNINVPIGTSQFNMGILLNFAMFTSIGAATNVGSSIIVGDIGTNNGTVTGFQDATLSGFIYLPNQGASFCQLSIYVDGVIVPTSARERSNAIAKEDIVLSDFVTITSGQTISIKVLNSIGISRFYNRNLTITKI